MTQYSGKIIRKNAVVPTQQSASGVWTVTDAAAATRNNAWPVAGVPDPISRSVRLRSSASAYLTRTQSASGNGHLWTYSGWVKRGALAMGRLLCTSASAGSANALAEIYFDASDRLTVFQYTTGTTYTNLVTTQVFRDPSAWYHVVVAYDDAQATAANRVKVYVNGVQVTSFSTASYPTQNFNSFLNTGSQPVWIGPYLGTSTYLDGYLTEVNFIDGQALTPSSFGTTDAFTGAWVPMAYTGTYGTNGFYLNFKDNTSTTTLGYDYSGNSNNWTANNISLTAGVTYDSMLDVPTPWIGYNTDGGVSVTRGNYCTWNPNMGATYGPSPNQKAPLSNGNLKVADAAGAYNSGTQGTIGASSGKWYWEYILGATAPAYNGTGVSFVSGWDNFQYGLTYDPYSAGGSIRVVVNGAATALQTSVGSVSAGDVIGVALDCDSQTIKWYKNNVQVGTTVTYTSYLPSGSTTVWPSWWCANTTGASAEATFGQRPFSYTPPTGFKALCTTNLPEPTIKLGASYFAASTYTGNGSTQSITNSGNNTTATTFQPDFVWLKNRSGVENHQVFDSVRGVNYSLYPNLTNSNTVDPGVTAFNSNGFSLAASSNTNAATYIGWQWKANGSAVSNTNGTITSQVNAGTTQGFSVVTYTGSGSNATVGHGLGVAPKMIIAKHKNAVDNWIVYHASLGGSPNYLWLNLTSSAGTSSTVWNTAPTSSVFGVGTDNLTNLSGGTYVAYCFAEVAGYSKFGSYTGNGSTDGPFVYCGFRPRWLMIKRTDTTGDWHVLDTSRDTYNVAGNVLYPNLSSAESGVVWTQDILSNGFKLRITGASENASGGTYIYACFAENPFKYSNAR